MSLQYPRLFEPLGINGVRLKNRIAMAPMGLAALHDGNGVPTERFIDYAVERAKGGVGLLMTGMLKIEEEIEYTTRRRGPVTAAFVRPMADLTEAAHALGAKVFAQLSAGFGCMARAESVRGGPVAPSAVPNFGDPRIICRALRTEEVEQLVRSYGDAAELMARAGVDGVELHGHGGFLLDQFTTALWNRRDDRYGGDLRGRMTFAFEIIAEIRRRLGDTYPVTYRYGLKHYMKSPQQSALPGEAFEEIGRDIADGLAMARLLEEAGIDALSIDAGTMVGHYWAHPPIYQEHGCNLHLSSLVKEAVTIPVFAAGRLDIPEVAEGALAAGRADLVMIGKGLLADPEWPNKAREGRADDIRPCIGCHQACTELIHGREVNSCSVNPASGRERSLQILPAKKARKILVAGGGPAGMETARIAAMRGHAVILYERDARLGGQLHDASVPTEKADIARLNLWYRRQLDNLGVDIRTGTELTRDRIEAEHPDAIVVASGSRVLPPKIPGIGKPHVADMTEVLRGERDAGHRVVIIGAGEHACELALWLTARSKHVTLVERAAQPIPGPLARANRNMLLDRLAAQKIPVVTETSVEKILDHAVVATGSDGRTREIACDTVIVAGERQADADLYDSQIGKFPGPVYAVGDCDMPGNIMKAVWDGFEVGRAV